MNETTNEVVVDKNELMANRIEELMTDGNTLTEALAVAQSEFAPKHTAPVSRAAIADRVSWISNLTRIDELRKAVKIAFAKKSKSKDKPDTIAKYQKEIDAGRNRLNELMAQVYAAPKPYLKALELGEDVSGILQKYLEYREKGLEETVKNVTKALSATARKDLLSRALPTTPWGVRAELLDLGDEYLAQYEARATKGDQRIITVNKRLNFLADQEIVVEDEVLTDVIDNLPPSEPTEPQEEDTLFDEFTEEGTDESEDTTPTEISEEPTGSETPVETKKNKKKKKK